MGFTMYRRGAHLGHVCDSDPTNKLSFPFPTKIPYEICFDMPSELVIFENGGQWADYDDGRTTDHGYTIYKSNNEPKGSG